MSSTGEQCFSGGIDGTIQCWNTPNPNIDPYDSYGKCLLLLGYFKMISRSVWTCLVLVCQTRQFCEERWLDTLTRFGAWSTAVPTSASCPALLMGLWDCGTPTASPQLWQYSMKIKVLASLILIFFDRPCFCWSFRFIQMSFISFRAGYSLLSGSGVQWTGPFGRILR